MSLSPLFSIVIPTRNRAHLLPNALRSALNQQFDDYEIVVVANDCQDDTKTVVEAIATKRVRYFATEKMLPAMDNWEFAWTKTSGQYVIFLSDDDALTPTALQHIQNALHGNPPIINWEFPVYYYPQSGREDLRNLLLMYFHHETTIEDLSSQTLRQQISRFDISLDNYQLPLMGFFALNKEYFENWRAQLGRLFYHPSGDSFTWIALHICPFIRIVHRPLTIRGVHDEAASSYHSGFELRPTWLEEHSHMNFFQDTGIDIKLAYNQIVSEYLRSNKVLEKCGIKPEPINMHRFIVALAQQMAMAYHRLPNSNQYANKLLEKAKNISTQLYAEVQTILAKPLPATPEPLRALHQRTRNMALEYLPNIENAMKQHAGDLQCALCTLALRDELLVDTNWSYLYLFGEVINANNIYTMSLHVEYYYDLLLSCRQKQCHPNMTNQSAEVLHALS